MKRPISRVGANRRRLVPSSIPMIQEKNKAMGIAPCSQAQTGSASGCEARLITTDSQLGELQTEWVRLFDVAPRPLLPCVGSGCGNGGGSTGPSTATAAGVCGSSRFAAGPTSSASCLSTRGPQAVLGGSSS